MLSEAPYADVYLGFQDLSRLRAAAHEQSPEALEGAARQFEAVFLKMMLKSMREAGFGDPLFDNETTGFYRDLFDHQLALNLSQGQGIGLADLLVQQLRGLVTDERVGDGSQLHSLPARLPGTATADGRASGNGTHSPSFESKAEFVRILRPYAQQAARRLGVPAELLLAQAALETGWGHAVIRKSDGESSHNLFGIKADGLWSGERVTVSTLEYRDGLPVRQQAQFRAYPSFADSFSDYVDLLKRSGRYADALTQAGDPEAFMVALQRAGYATDPAYARKVVRIWRQEMAEAVKTASGAPI